ncbi:hypothetical protein AX15_001630 [Amanita polypyramis BW_CC]|nr:hypothetical protein AX15_001630 [Amanita polypyramis BW_CC]
MSSPKLRWPKSKPPSPHERPSKLSLNSLFGLKSKRPAVSIPHDPPSASTASTARTSDAASPRASRSPSKSMSSTRSYIDSAGPKTPTDGLSESRQSLLTLSDNDPFAGRGISVVSSPQSIISPNRLSIRSDTSLPELIGGKLDDRALLSSPALLPAMDESLSPDSYLFTSRPAPTHPNIPRARRFVLKSDLARKRSAVTPDASEISTKASSSTLKEEGRLPIPIRPMRARGLTESAMINRSDSFPNSGTLIQVSGVPFTPAIPSRQLSLCRRRVPLSAPPSHELPPPPICSIPPAVDVSSGDDNAVLPESTSSPTLSLSTVSSDAYLSRSPRKKGKLPESNLTTTQNSMATIPIRKPKKAASHGSLTKLSISISSLESSESQAEEEQRERSPRKQHSFHRPKLPTLAITNRPTSTFPMPSSGSHSPVTEQRLGSASPLIGRRRLFSATRRPSTSRSTSVEDDTQSVLSWRSEQSQPFRPWTRSTSCSPSFGDDGTSDEPSSPQLASRYTPQRIMSPAEMAEVAASVERVTSPRSRGLSISTITSFKDQEGGMSTPTTSPPLSPFGSNSKSSSFPSRSGSILLKNSTSPQGTSTAQASITNEQSAYQPSSSPPLSLMSLPPPPRPRQRTTTAPPSSKAPTEMRHHHDSGFQSLAQPLPRRGLLPKASVEKFLRRRSLLRKPSFLEIDDDVAQDTYGKSRSTKSPDDSFLDLTRESFETCVEEY